MRCGVVARYCCQTWLAIWTAEAFVFRVEGPEESVEGVEGAGAEVVEAACRLAGIVAGVWVSRALLGNMVFLRVESVCASEILGLSRIWMSLESAMAWGEEGQLMPAGSFVIAGSRG